MIIAAFASGVGFGILALVGFGVTGGRRRRGRRPDIELRRVHEGFPISVNAGLNGVLAAAVFGPGIGLVLGVINFVAAFDGVHTNPVDQGILGWPNFLQPMSWLFVARGLITFVFNLLSHVIFRITGDTFEQQPAGY